jgi:predicted alpha/beta superfamily hydrolase
MSHEHEALKPHTINQYVVRSEVIGQEFTIKVLKPLRRADESERFPVLYMTDADDNFEGCAALANALQVCGDAARFILVGIGYGDAQRAELLRMRDLLTHRIRTRFRPSIERLAASSLLGGIDDLRTVTESTDAGEFLSFITQELMPFIESRYPSLAEDNGYFGYSAGGTFGLYALFERPAVFRRYILGSPAVSYESHHFGIELARAFMKSGRTLDAELFLSVGELEELHPKLGQYDLVTGCYLMAKFLKAASLPGLRLSMRIFPDETHASAWAPAFSHGVRTLFRSGDTLPFWLE